MRPGALRVGIWQGAGSDNVPGNLALIAQAAEHARERRLELLVFPECFLTGYYRRHGVREMAQTVNEKTIDALCRTARSADIALCVGTYELCGDAVHNSALFVPPSGRPLVRYRKRALFGDWEKAEFAPGRSTAIFDYRGVRLGILICFDVEFPELARELALGGAELVVVPTALMEPYENIATLLVPTRAIENQLYLAYANRVGAELDQRYVGRSRICSPTGDLLAAASADRDELISAEIDTALLDRTRREYPYLGCLAALGDSGSA